jgi:hypothetical protein
MGVRIRIRGMLPDYKPPPLLVQELPGGGEHRNLSQRPVLLIFEPKMVDSFHILNPISYTLYLATILTHYGF